MKINAILLFLTMAICNAEDWKTTDGKVYAHVIVLKAEADAVTILDSDGGARIELWKLSPELQKRFNFDPNKAVVAAQQHQRELNESNQAMSAEANAAVAIQNKKLALDSSPTAPASTATAPAGALTQEQRTALQNHLDSLSKDIAFMQQEEAKVIQSGTSERLRQTGTKVSTGAYADKIAQEQAEADSIRAQLNGAVASSN